MKHETASVWGDLHEQVETCRVRPKPKGNSCGQIDRSCQSYTPPTRGRWRAEAQTCTVIRIKKYARLVDGSAGRWPFTLNDDDELYGLIDRSGNVIAPQRFTYGSSFENELSRVEVLDGSKSYTGYIDKSGKLIWRDS